MHIGTLKSKLNERIEEEYCSSPAPVATYRARFPQQSATSAVQEWLVQVLTAICIKVLNGGLNPSKTSKKKIKDGWSVHNSIDNYILVHLILYINNIDNKFKMI